MKKAEPPPIQDVIPDWLGNPAGRDANGGCF